MFICRIHVLVGECASCDVFGGSVSYESVRIRVAERTTVAELAEDLLRDYRINGKKSVSDVETRWNLHLKPFLDS